jgi:hypothetical protein
MTPGLIRIIAIMACLAGLAGCMSQMRAESARPVRCKPIEAFVKSDGLSYGAARIGVFYAREPDHAVGISREVTSMYADELVKSGVFSQVKRIPYTAWTAEEVIWWGRQEGCDLAMEPEIVYLLTGSGTMPTKLGVRVRIIDTRTGGVLWDLQQWAYSEPGKDVDLFWHTVSGQSAQRHGALAKALAEQLPRYLAAGKN